MTCTETRFLRDVADHQMIVIRDDGVNRHIRFKRPGTSCYQFDLVTWAGYLCYAGDMGTYVFTRIADMFEFFRRSPSSLFRIDFRYWAEKCEAGDKSDGIREYDAEAFKTEIRRQKGQLALRYYRILDTEQFADLMSDLDNVINSEDEYEAIQSVRDFQFTYRDKGGEHQHIHLCTDDFPTCKRYSFRFVWCCYALAWGVKQYDDAKASAEAEA